MTSVAVEASSIEVLVDGELCMFDQIISGEAADAAEQAAGRQLASELSEDCTGVTAVVTLNGAVNTSQGILNAVEDVRPGIVDVDYIAAHSYDGTESTGELDVRLDLRRSITGKDVWLIEDVIDTGITLKYLLGELALRRPRSMKVVSLLSKPGPFYDVDEWTHAETGLVVPIRPLFRIGGRFVLGRGLDYKQRYRNLRGVYAMRDEVV